MAARNGEEGRGEGGASREGAGRGEKRPRHLPQGAYCAPKSAAETTGGESLRASRPAAAPSWTPHCDELLSICSCMQGNTSAQEHGELCAALPRPA